MQPQPFLIYRSTLTSCSKCVITLERYICRSWIVWGSYFIIFTETLVLFRPARRLSAENPDLVQLKSLLAGLTLPVKSSSAEVAAEERDGKNCLYVTSAGRCWHLKLLHILHFLNMKYKSSFVYVVCVTDYILQTHSFLLSAFCAFFIRWLVNWFPASRQHICLSVSECSWHDAVPEKDVKRRGSRG